MKQELYQAKQKWAQRRDQNYAVTIVLMIAFQGPAHGLVPMNVDLAVEDGRVVDADSPYGLASMATAANIDLSDFLNSMTIEARFERVERLIDSSFKPPCYSTLEVEYDPMYGYVTQINSDSHGQLNPYYTGSCHPRYGCPISPDYRLEYAEALRWIEPTLTPTNPISLTWPTATSLPSLAIPTPK